MKLQLFAALSAFTIIASAQEVKESHKPQPPAPAVTSRPLTHDEQLEFDLATARIQNINTKYKINEYNQEIAPFSASQSSVAKAACASVGISESQFPNGCGFTTGHDADGKPVMGADGKPVVPHVWNVAEEAKAAAAAAKK